MSVSHLLQKLPHVVSKSASMSFWFVIIWPFIDCLSIDSCYTKSFFFLKIPLLIYKSTQILGLTVISVRAVHVGLDMVSFVDTTIRSYFSSKFFVTIAKVLL